MQIFFDFFCKIWFDGGRWTPLSQVWSPSFSFYIILLQNLIPGGIILGTKIICYNNAIPCGIFWVFWFLNCDLYDEDDYFYIFY